MMTHDDEHDFAQFGGSLKSNATASPAFANRVRARMYGAVAPHMPEPVRLIEKPAPPQSATGSIAWPSWRRWLDQVGAAAIILLALTVIAGSLMIVAPDSGSRQGLQTVEDINAGNINVGGNAGRTGAISDETPSISGLHEGPSIPIGTENDFPLTQYGIVVGNQFIFVVGTNTGPSWVISYDLLNHAITWKVSSYTNGEVASDGERVFLMQFDQAYLNRPHVGGNGTVRMTAFDLETGETLWQGPELTLNDKPVMSTLLASDVVYGTDSLGNVQALDTESGALLWQYPETPNTPPATPLPPDDEFNEWYEPSLAANSQALYATQPDNTVLAFDRITGTLRGTVDTEQETGDDVDFIYLQTTEEHVVMTVARFIQGEATPAGTVMVTDAVSGTVQQKVAIEVLMSLPVVTRDAVYVAMASDPSSQARIHRIDMGSQGEPLPIGEASAGGKLMSLSVAGNALIVISMTYQVSVIDMATGETTWSGTLPIEEEVGGYVRSALLWGNNLIVVTDGGQVFVLTVED